MLGYSFNKIVQYLAQTSVLARLFIFVEFSRVIGFIPHIPEFFVYGIMICCAYDFVKKSKKTNSLFLSLLLYIPIEIIITSPLPLFKPWTRYILLCVLLFSSSSLFQSEINRNTRVRIYNIVCGICAFLGVGSFFARYTGVNYMIIQNTDIINNVGLFGGLTNHSMLLGPIAAVGVLFLLNKSMSSKGRIWWIMTVMSMCSVMFASSRSAFVSVIVGILVYLYVRSNRASRLLKYVIILMTSVSITLPLWQNAMSGLIEKQQNNTELGGTFASREDKWVQRIQEFESSPILGYGFCSVDPSNRDNSIGADGSSMEPGSSWLSVISMLGVIGAILVFVVVRVAFVQVYVNEKDPFLSSMLSMLFVNMCTEGYIFFAGSFLCFFFWLTTAVCMDRKYGSNYVVR